MLVWEVEVGREGVPIPGREQEVGVQASNPMQPLLQVVAVVVAAVEDDFDPVTVATSPADVVELRSA